MRFSPPSTLSTKSFPIEQRLEDSSSKSAPRTVPRETSEKIV